MSLLNLPQHVAIIMDGNGRWAKKRFLPRLAGHRAGMEAARKAITFCAKKGISVLSLFAFSSENWRRPTDEVNFLMELFLRSLEKEVKELHQHNIQIRFIGARERFNDKLKKKMAEVESLMHHNTGMVILLAIDYGGQWDIFQATRKIAENIERGCYQSQDLTPEHIASHLSFADLPNPDLFIRTSGEMRISNFMLWQIAYAELFFTETLWPDFDDNELQAAFSHFATRNRRFGFVSA